MQLEADREDVATTDEIRRDGGGLRRKLVAMSLDPDIGFRADRGDLAALQLAAVDALFQERITQIPLLRKRAEDAGIARITAFADLVPLLFAHTVYKSYPQHFVEKGRWDAMLKWLQTLSVADVSNVDITDVRDVDDWVERLWAAGHAVLTTSGSSGKVSFLNHTMEDRARKTMHIRQTQTYPYIKPGAVRPVVWLGPMVGRNSAVEMAISIEEIWGLPGQSIALDEHPLLISEVSSTAAMRKKLADGTASPEEIEAFERAQNGKATAAADEMRRLADRILDMRHEPFIMFGLWAQHLMIRDRARERGIADGDFHPDTIIFPAGGIKGIALPDDYREQVAAFYGPAIQIGNYGMTEMAQLFPRCPAHCYHAPPGLILLMLDREGERLLGPEDAVDGKITGRVGFLDLLYEGRWGGLITGDKATLDLSERCACGLPGPMLTDDISRFSQSGEEDHIGCAGTIDAYIRGGLPS
jgi:hypothetical protein